MVYQNLKDRMGYLQLQKSVQLCKFLEFQYGGLRVIKLRMDSGNSELGIKI